MIWHDVVKRAREQIRDFSHYELFSKTLLIALMSNYFLDLEQIKTLAMIEPKSLLERFVKLSEECGELAQELLIHHKSSGSTHKEHGEDGIKGESVDILLVALSIYFKAGGTMEELALKTVEKCQKWQKFQRH